MIDLAWPGPLADDLALRSDVVVTWLGTFGAVLFLRAARRTPSGAALQARAQFLLGVLAVMLFIRGFAWMAPDADWLGVVFHVPATLQPLALSVFVEGLLRRHLTVGLKRLIAGITVVAFVGNIVTGIIGDGRPRVIFSIGFLLLLMVTLAALGIALLRRDRSTLSSSENALIRDIIVLATVGVGLAATDFRDVLGILPVRAGTLAVLLLAFVLLSQPAGDSARRVLAAAARLVLWGIAGATVITFVLGTRSAEGVLATIVVSVALVLLVGIANRSRELAHGADIDWLLRWLGRPAPATLVEWERTLRELPLTADAILVNEHDLDAYHLEAMRRIAEQAGPVIPRAALRSAAHGGTPQDAIAADEFADLLERNEASHVGVLSVRPLRLLLVTLPEVPGSRGADVALGAIMRHGASAAAADAGVPAPPVAQPRTERSPASSTTRTHG